MSKFPAARYRTTNWKSYNDALKRRGSLLIRCPATHAFMRERVAGQGHDVARPESGPPRSPTSVLSGRNTDRTSW